MVCAQDEFDALTLHEAFAGMGCNKKVVVEVLTTRPFARLQAARAFYERRYDSGLLDRLRCGCPKCLFISMCV